MKITYIHHSAFCIETDGIALVFDYFKGDCIPSCTYHGTLPELGKDTPVYVFSSHSHRDHFDMEALTWRERYPNIHYIFAKEIKKKLGNSMLRRLGIPESIKETITYVKPGECYNVDGVTVETLLSTDSGVAFLVTVPPLASQHMDSHAAHSPADGTGEGAATSGTTIYHAGDLNWWRWEGEPEDFNAYQEKTYKEQIALLSGRKVDVAFVVLDPRQERDQFLGIDYFMEHVEARYVVPMHMWKQYGLAQEYQNRPQSRRFREKICSMSKENQEIVLDLPCERKCI